MTLDEAIIHAEEVAEEQKAQAWEAQLQEEYEKIKSCKKCSEEHKQLAAWLKELRQLREQTKWIPVSEGLPNLDDYTGSQMWQKKVLIIGYLSFDDTKDLFVSEAFAEDVIHDSVLNTVVVAWMPLPKPYKRESEE